MELFNQKILEKWRDLDPGSWHVIALDILYVFFKSSITDYENLKKACASKDAHASHLHAHSLKSCYGTVGALQLQALFADIESASLAQKWSEIEVLLKQVDQNRIPTHALVEQFKKELELSVKN